jgi:Cyclic nucleotide-binding domain
MPSTENRNDYFIWGVDQVVYGPVELPTVIDWIKDERVLPETWIYVSRDVAWKQAPEIPELQMFFRPKSGTASPDSPDPPIKPGVLRRVKILACLDDAQLTRFARFMELEPVKQWAVVVKQGDHGDSMYLILEGELRVRLQVGDRETILATLGPGDFFGDISLFDHGPRSADVVANVDSIVLKIAAASFEKLAREAPEVAAPFLTSTIRTLAARIRADNKRLRDSVSFSGAAGH